MQSVTAPLGGGAKLVHALAKNWWLVLLRGIVSVLFGIVAFIWPGLTLVTLVLHWRVYAVVPTHSVRRATSCSRQTIHDSASKHKSAKLRKCEPQSSCQTRCTVS